MVDILELFIAFAGLIVVALIGFGIYLAVQFAKGLDPFDKGTGKTCSLNINCSNGACGLSTAAEDATKICCTTGTNEIFDGRRYCTGLTSGQSCRSDAMCADGLYCPGGSISTIGTCIAQTDLGGACTSDSQCPNGLCENTNAALTSLICCPGDTTLCGVHTYCFGIIPSGQPCAFATILGIIDHCDDPCASGVCSDGICT